MTMVCAQMWAQTIVGPKGKVKGQTSFAVITDQKTWNACREAITAYQQMLGEEGLPTYIVYKDWASPEEVKTQLINLHRDKKLEGAVFVGDVPVAMIRKAQHMTSAFKMDEKNYPWRDCSVPSDRFYDDFHLQFDFLKRDSVEKNFFYYDLAVKSPQQIRCDIYTGRIKPVANGRDPYTQISDYLMKAIREHRSGNRLDNFQSYTGHGSYSNSLTAWTQESQTVREQFPGVFDTVGRARFMRYSMFDYPKQTVCNTLRRSDIDLMIFHEHGTPDRQYLSASPETTDFRSHIDAVKYYLRDWIRRHTRRGKAASEVYAQAEKMYDIDSTWFAGWDDPKVVAEDSLQDLKTGIVLTDIDDIKPNTRMVIFDACYNGDFREADYMAGRYIFAGGQTVACFANSVNVLQDKMANEMLGLMGLGARIGQWAKTTNILESHIIGDPTFRFESNVKGINLARDLSVKYSAKTELKRLQSPLCDMRCIAMHRLFDEGYEGISDLLYKRFIESEFAMERYTALSLLKRLADQNFQKALDVAIDDSNEFIRRSTVLWMSEVGLDRYAEPMVREFVENYFSEREAFDIIMHIRAFSPEAFNAAIEKVLGPEAYVLDRDFYRQKLEKAFADQKSHNEDIFDRNAKPGMRSLMVSSLRNCKIAATLDGYLTLLKDKSETERVRWEMLDALAWYTLSARKADIMAAVKVVMDDVTESQSLRQKAERTYYRLK